MILQNHMPAAYFCVTLKKNERGTTMDIDGYVSFLEGQRLSPAGIATRKRKLNDAEEYIGKSLDEVVADDNEMYWALIKLQEVDDPAHTPRQNALRKYYAFKNGKEFPRLSKFELLYRH